MVAKNYVGLFLCALVLGAYALNAIGQMRGTFHFEPHWSLLYFFGLYALGGGVHDMSMKGLEAARKKFLPPAVEVANIVVDEVTGTHERLVVDVEPVEDKKDGLSPGS